MARVGEGDPRWLVQNRPDGKNVGNWHWSEKNLMPYTKQTLKKLFEAVQVPTEDSSIVTFSSLESVKGEITLNNRKRRVFYLYELEVKVLWSGSTADGASGKGLIKAKEISQDNPDDQFEVEVTMDNEDEKNKILKEHVKKTGVQIFKETIKKFLTEMRKENNENSIVSPEPEHVAPSYSPVILSRTNDAETNKTDTGKISTKSIRQKVIFSGCAPQFLYETFMDSGRMSGATQAPAHVVPQVNGDFSLFAGSVTGKTVELTPGEKIVQKWRFSSWPQDHFSTVTFSFKPDSQGTELLLEQVGIPSSDYDRTLNGWESHFWQRIRAAFGWTYKMKS
eukprot:TRINITY_DN3062_c0_g1_i1.p1 TRINITY_DN3062_c0_g1~~TRINITY_DN3062_c0_g1_i1.p1  ORF type:complete len:336 (-),score=74.95 TRINITY_DN3062_c0_g1_i1:7-1014(-)